MAKNQDFTLNIKALFDASDVKNKVNDLQGAFKNIKLPDNLQKSFDKTINDLVKSVNDFESKAGKGIKNKTDANGITKAIDNVIKDFTKVEDVITKIQSEINSSTDLSKIIKLNDSDLQKIQQLKDNIKQLQQQISDIQTSNLDKITAALDNIKSKGAKAGAQRAIELFNNGEIEESLQLLEKVKQKQQQIADGKGNYSEKAQQTAENNVKALKSLIETFSNTQIEVKNLTDEINNETKEMGEIAKKGYEEIVDGANKAGQGLHETAEGAKEARDGIVDAAEGTAQFNGEVDQLKSRIQYFFGLNNAIQFVKRTMREAYNTIKELDKAMTETAVVTDFSVGDMWAQLPEYTKRANELGVSTKAAYEAATLYYQQGLKTNEVMAMSNETLKMARIAGLDAAVATDRMTNAIRGFNMEINTTNAQRIDDVYSKLAAISASNVDEISTAMTKVASLAHSANMEFETTAAFLAQIIETTRESAETAGTALKTVVARFSEVKKLVSEGALSGADEEGEIIDVNKVSSALRVAGIDLNKYFLGEVGLDDIFMELASKWKSLTQLQQRFIATQAAGSRQQSRFIALMSDYARTQELVGEAYNANGAAAKQFEKTQESLESKLARLKNAWNEFAMGVLNNDIVKWGVDALTGLLNGINALTSGFDTLNTGAGKFLNTFAKLTLLIGGLKVGKGLTAGLFGSMLSMVSGGAIGGNFANIAAGAMGVNPGQNLLTTLGAGAINPFKNVATGLKNTGGIIGKGIWAGAKGLGRGIASNSGIVGNLGSGIISGLAGTGMTSGTAAGILGLSTAITGITVAAGAAYVAIKKLYDASPAGQVKIAEKYADSLNEVANAARSSQREFESIQEEYNRLEANVQQATTAEERTEAIKSRTEYIQSLLEQNAAYAQYIDQYEVKNGEIFLTLDSDKLAEACEKIAETALKVQSGADIANANVAFQRYQEAQNDIAKLERQKVLIEAEQPANQTEAEEKEWRESSGLNQIEASLIQATNRMLNFQQEYQNFATSSAIKNIQNNENLDDVAKSAIANALGYAFNGDEIQKILVDNTTDLFGLIPETVFHGIDHARKRWMDTFETTDIPDDIYNDEKKLIDAAAQEEVRKTLEKSGDKLIDAYSILNDEQKEIFTDLINSSGKNLNLTTTQSISNNLPRILGDFWNLLDKELQQKLIENSSGLSPIQTAQDIISKTFLEGSSENSNLFSKIFDFIFDFNLSGKQTEIISKIFTDFAKDNYESLQPFTDFINNLITTVTNTKDPELISSFFDALATLDTDSATNINTFFDLLDGLGIDFTKVEGSAEAAAGRLKELANVKDPFNAEELSTKVSDAVSTIWDIRERKPTQQGYRTFSESEYKIIEDAVKALGPEIDINLDDIFKRTGIKNKEWNYVGGDLEELVQLLVQDLNKAIQQAEDYISAPEWFNTLSTDFENQEKTFEVEGYDQNLSLEEVLREISANQEVINKLSPEDQNIIRDIISDLGYEWQQALTSKGLVDVIKEALTEYDQFSANKETQPEIDRATQSVDYLTSVNQLNPTKEERPGITGERYTSAIEGKFAVDEHAGDRFEDILEILTLLEEKSNAFKKSLKDFNIDADTASRALAVNWSETAAQLSELTEVLDKNDKILYESSKESYEYSGAIHAVGEAMRAVYGQQVSDEFVQAHIQQIVMARESKEVYEELLTVLQQNFFSGAIEGAEGLAGTLWNVQQEMLRCAEAGYALDGLEINGVAVLDGTPWMKVVADLIAAGADVEAFFNTLGWTVVYRKDAKGNPVSVQLVRNQPTGYGGYKPYTGNNWGRGSSGSGGSSPKEKEPTKEEWRSDFDWLYNLMEDITELQREQNKLQEEQNKILELGNDSDTGKDLYENLVKQMANLLTQKTYQSTVSGYRRREMQEFMAANAGYGEYFRFNDQDQTLEINWDAINEIGDKETYEKVKDLVSEAEAIQKKMDDSEDAVRDIETQIRQLENIWRDSYVSFEKRVLDALVKSYQRVIDNYSDLNDTVTRTNNDILNAIQKEISLERQIRDNTETEDSISDAEARLAFLRRDTTGGNQVEILNAQKELDEQRRQYEDTLIDQAIARLQDDNEVAAEQRDEQIELMQAQLDYAAETGAFNDQVYALIAGALGADGELLTNSDLFELLQQEESWAAMSDTSKQVWEDELNNTFKEVSAYLLKQQGEIDGSYLQAVAAEINDGVWASAQITGDSLQVGLGNIGDALAVGLDSIGWSIGSLSQAMDHIAYSFSDAVNALSDANAQLANAAASQQYQEPTELDDNQSQGRRSYKHDEYEYQQGLGIQTYGGVGYTVVDPNGNPITTTHQGGSYDQVLEDLKKLRGYKTGGLTTKTGLAWLDGTPSEPEYVLNARQTDAFLKLAEVLPSMLNGTSTTTNTIGGNMYLEFHVNVDNISDDYDVDQLVERVKEDIYSAASYRNANIINFSR